MSDRTSVPAVSQVKAEVESAIRSVVPWSKDLTESQWGLISQEWEDAAAHGLTVEDFALELSNGSLEGFLAHYAVETVDCIPDGGTPAVTVSEEQQQSEEQPETADPEVEQAVEALLETWAKQCKTAAQGNIGMGKTALAYLRGRMHLSPAVKRATVVEALVGIAAQHLDNASVQRVNDLIRLAATAEVFCPDGLPKIKTQRKGKGNAQGGGMVNAAHLQAFSRLIDGDLQEQYQVKAGLEAVSAALWQEMVSTGLNGRECDRAIVDMLAVHAKSQLADAEQKAQTNPTPENRNAAAEARQTAAEAQKRADRVNERPVDKVPEPVASISPESGKPNQERAESSPLANLLAGAQLANPKDVAEQLLALTKATGKPEDVLEAYLRLLRREVCTPVQEAIDRCVLAIVRRGESASPAELVRQAIGATNGNGHLSAAK